eukprot:91932_1
MSAECLFNLVIVSTIITNIQCEMNCNAFYEQGIDEMLLVDQCYSYKDYEMEYSIMYRCDDYDLMMELNAQTTYCPFFDSDWTFNVETNASACYNPTCSHATIQMTNQCGNSFWKSDLGTQVTFAIQMDQCLSNATHSTKMFCSYTTVSEVAYDSSDCQGEIASVRTIVDNEISECDEGYTFDVMDCYMMDTNHPVSNHSVANHTNDSTNVCSAVQWTITDETTYITPVYECVVHNDSFYFVCDDDTIPKMVHFKGTSCTGEPIYTEMAYGFNCITYEADDCAIHSLANWNCSLSVTIPIITNLCVNNTKLVCSPTGLFTLYYDSWDIDCSGHHVDFSSSPCESMTDCKNSSVDDRCAAIYHPDVVNSPPVPLDACFNGKDGNLSFSFHFTCDNHNGVWRNMFNSTSCEEKNLMGLYPYELNSSDGETVDCEGTPCKWATFRFDFGGDTICTGPTCHCKYSGNQFEGGVVTSQCTLAQNGSWVIKCSNEDYFTLKEYHSYDCSGSPFNTERLFTDPCFDFLKCSASRPSLFIIIIVNTVIIYLFH